VLDGDQSCPWLPGGRGGQLVGPCGSGGLDALEVVDELAGPRVVAGAGS
jgi:hypothetical protein